MQKRTGDTVKIGGNYQYKAITEGNPVQRFWHYSKQAAIGKLLKPEPIDNVLDVGCGSGVITSYLGMFANSATGIDGNADAIGFAKNQFENQKTFFLQGLVDEKFSIDTEIDKIYCLEVIEHIYYQQSFEMLKMFYNLLKKDGKVFISTPNYKSFWPLIEWLMDQTGVAPQLLEEQHVEFYNKNKLKKLCIDVGFKIELLVTNCFAAPWIAPFSWTLAKKIDDFETSNSYLPGSIIITVLNKL